MSYIFGPVSSRRLGFSLGVDIIPRKWCSYDCVYCEVGRTTHKSVKLQAFTGTDSALSELREFLKIPGHRIDYITLAGSGEPTLNAELGRIISEIKSFTDLPVALLTNGSLFFKREVRQAVGEADLILPSLDTADEESFKVVNRPHDSLNLQLIIEGLVKLRDEYTGRIWLEVLMVEGLNNRPEQILALKRAIEQIKPDRVQLNTVVRPGTESRARAVSPEGLADICRILGEHTEIVASFRSQKLQNESGRAESQIVNMLRRRPCPVDEISRATGLNDDRLTMILEKLIKEQRIHYDLHNGKGFYLAP